MENEVQLLPCPFKCAEPPILKHYQRSAFVTDYWVTCPICGCTPGKMSTPAQAVTRWNTRVSATEAH